jgi:antitoxin HicB
MSCKSVIAGQLSETMKAKRISRQEMAKRMATSRAQVARLFDPKNDRVRLDTIQRAAQVLGMRVKITFEDAAVVKPGPRRGRREGPTANTIYTMWLCHELVRMADLNTEFLSQHKHPESAGGYVTVGEKLHMTASAVERHVSNARERSDTEYYEWKEQWEKQWWLYHSLWVEKRELPDNLLYRVLRVGKDTVPTKIEAIHKEIEELVAKAQKRRDKDARGEQDYQTWLAAHELRDEKRQSQPYRWRPASTEEAITAVKTRLAKGLRIGLTGRGAPRGPRKASMRHG